MQHTQSSQHVMKLRHNFYNKLIKKLASNWQALSSAAVPKVVTRSMMRRQRVMAVS